jgi:carbon-monoxide dehydrogenase large subunit
MDTFVGDAALPSDIDEQPMLRAAAALRPLLRRHHDEIEEEQRLPPSLVAALRETGCYRLLIPQTLGGLQVDPLTYLRVVVAGTDRALSFREIAKAVYSEIGRLPREAREELEVTRVYDPYFGTTTAATHIAALEIDPETFKVRLDRYLVAEDCGRLINPMIVDGQVHGAVVQGIGAALSEEVIYDDRGQLLTASFGDYGIPVAGEVPPIKTIHLETASPSTLGGFRGMGEGGTIGAPAAIANALADALAPLGGEICELPMTPERLFCLAQKLGAG